MIGKNKVFAYLLVGVLIAVLTAVSQGATITWTSQVEGDWNNRFNWTPNQVPTSADDVIHDGNGAGVIRVNIADAACKTFTATAGGTPLRGLRILPSMRLKVTNGFVVQDQTEQVRYLTEVKVFGVLETAQPNGVIDGGDFLLQPHSLVHYFGDRLHMRNGVWTLRGGRFITLEAHAEEWLGYPEEAGKIIVEKGGFFNGYWARVGVDEVEVQAGGGFVCFLFHPDVRVTSSGGLLAVTTLTLDPPSPGQSRTAAFATGSLARNYHNLAYRFFVAPGNALVYEGAGSLLEIAALNFHRDVPAPDAGGVIKAADVQASLRVASTTGVSIATRGADFKDWDARGVTVVAPQKLDNLTTLEAYYPDVGPYLFEDVPCSHWAELHIESTATLRMLDDVVENMGYLGTSTADAVYVRGSVRLELNATLDLNGVNVYHAGAKAHAHVYSILEGGGALVPVHVLKYGDFDGDGDVDSTDYAEYFQPAYSGGGSPTSCPLADADCDTDVDSDDYERFWDNFTGSNPTLPPVGMAECGTQEGGGPSGPQPSMSPVEEHAAFILANFDRERINLWVSVLGDRASRAATAEQRAELEALARLLANGVAP